MNTSFGTKIVLFLGTAATALALPPGRPVPDSGSSIALLVIAIAGLVGVRRWFHR